MNITRETYPVGTPVKDSTGDTGTVLGWHKSNISIRWNNGGTVSAPAHFASYAKGYQCSTCGRIVFDDVTDHALVAHRA